MTFDGVAKTGATVSGKRGMLSLGVDDIHIVADSNKLGSNKMTLARVKAISEDTNLTIKGFKTLTVGDSAGGDTDIDLTNTGRTAVDTFGLESAQVNFNAGSSVKTAGGSVAIKTTHFTLATSNIIDTSTAPGSGASTR